MAKRQSSTVSTTSQVDRDIDNTAYDNVKKVADNINNVTTVANNEANLITVATISDNVTTVANNETDIVTVASNETDLQLLADHIDGTISTNIPTVGTDLELGATSKIKVVNDNIADVTTVATDIANVNTTATNIADVNTIATNVADVNVVADNIDGTTSTNVVTVGTDLELGASSTIKVVNDNIADIGTVATDIDNVNTAATNITHINSFSLIYQISATEPTQRIDSTPLQEGDLWFDTVANSLKKYDGAIYVDTTIDALETAVMSFTNKTIVDLTNNVSANRVFYKVKATESINKGQPVITTGYNVGQSALEIALADNTTGIATGLADRDMLTGEFGGIVGAGSLEDFDTSSWAEGSILYVNGTGNYYRTYYRVCSTYCLCIKI